MINIKTLDHVALYVQDVDKTVDFYKNVLELPQIPRPAFSFPGAWFQLGASQELHIIGGRDHPVYGQSRGNHFALAVESIQETERFLQQKNYPHGAPRQRPDGIWQLYIQDPDGYCIEFTEL